MASETAQAAESEVQTEQAHCETHGAFTRNVITLFGRTMRAPCPVCTAERKAEEADRQRIQEEHARRSALARKLDSALIPYRFQDRTFENYTATSKGQQKALKVCREYAEQFDQNHQLGRCLILSGKPGTGKTHLAAAIANDLIHNSRATVVYRTVGAMLTYIKGSYDSHDYSEADAIKSLVSPSLLILDEIGATKPSEFELAMLFNVINGRYEQQLPTLIISNLPPAEIGPAIGERCLDRLREGGGIALTFDWDSARREIKA